MLRDSDDSRSLSFGWRLAWGLLAWIVGILPPLAAQTTVAHEYPLKAAFLYNFSNFIKWPATAFASPKSEFAICVLGEDPFDAILDHTVEDRQGQNGHPLALRRFSGLGFLDRGLKQDQTVCHILFVSASTSDTKHLGELNTMLADRPILTVGESEHFICDGGMVQFFIQKKKIRLGIDPIRVSAVKLVPDGGLLQLSKIIIADRCPATR